MTLDGNFVTTEAVLLLNYHGMHRAQCGVIGLSQAYSVWSRAIVALFGGTVPNKCRGWIMRGISPG